MDILEPRNRRKRRWGFRQYSLSTLLVVVTVVGVGLGVVTNRAERQRRAVAGLRESSGSVTYDFEQQRGGSPEPDWVGRNFGVDYSARVIRAAVPNDEGCSYLRGLPHVEELSLGKDVSDAGLMHLSGLTRLQRLLVSDTRFTGTGLVHLTGLTNLEVMFARGSAITDASLVHLGRLKGLKELHLSDTQIGDVGLAHLEGLTTLEELSLYHTRVTDGGLVHLQRMRKLERLNLSGLPITDAVLADLAGLTSLKGLFLEDTGTPG